MVANRRRRSEDEDDEPSLSVLPPGDDDDQETDEQEGLAHARRSIRARPSRVRDDEDDEDADTDQVIPDRVMPLKLPAPWSHLRIWAWLDYPEDVARLFGPKTADETDDEAGERIMEGMRTVITRHDGWRDRDGVIPQPSSRKFWSRISTPLARAITQGFFTLMRANPTPAASPKKKRRG